MSVAGVARRYAKALFSVASESGKIDSVNGELAALAQAWNGSSEMRAAFENPSVTPELRHKILDAVGSKLGLSAAVLAAAKLLATKQRMAALGEVTLQFDAFRQLRTGTVQANVTTAKKLDAKAQSDLVAALEKSTGRKVELTVTEDASILGGIITRVGDVVYDGSLKNRLADLEHQMLKAVQG